MNGERTNMDEFLEFLDERGEIQNFARKEIAEINGEKAYNLVTKLPMEYGSGLSELEISINGEYKDVFSSVRITDFFGIVDSNKKFWNELRGHYKDEDKVLPQGWEIHSNVGFVRGIPFDKGPIWVSFGFEHYVSPEIIGDIIIELNHFVAKLAQVLDKKNYIEFLYPSGKYAVLKHWHCFGECNLYNLRSNNYKR